MSYFCRIFSAYSRIAFFLRYRPLPLENSGCSVDLSTMLSITDILPISPILLRSSGIWDTFSSIKPLGVNVATFEPFMSTSPLSGVITPVTT